MKRLIVVGAGVGGLTTGALLARAGLDVTVLEAQVYAGGCASTFFHQGYRFDAGATVSAGFDHAGLMTRLGEMLGITWRAEAMDTTMVVHLSNGERVTRWTDQARWNAERHAHFGDAGETFWRWQEKTADTLWGAAMRGMPLPPQSLDDVFALAKTGLRALAQKPDLPLDAFRAMSSRLHNAPENLRQFIDAQLLISAQVTSESANALYGAAALDLPRRGVAHLSGGIGAIASNLVDAIRRLGGQVHFKHAVTRVQARGDEFVVETKSGNTFSADAVIFNLPPWDAANLLGIAPKKNLPSDGWGAFVVYAGFENSIVPNNFALHHQIIAREPLAEGNSIFVSLAPANDATRAPAGHRAMTISTHTALFDWWHLFERDRAAYEARKHEYAERMLATTERVLPGLRGTLKLMMPGTPVTYQRFINRSFGWVGGFPQTHLLRALGPNLGARAWLVGDSIFPGQSTLAVALGGMRVADAVLKNIGCSQTRRTLRLTPSLETRG